MAARYKKAAPIERVGLDAAGVVATYAGWLERQPLADRSREAYLAQVRSFVTWLAGSEHGAAALSDPAVRNWAVRDYKRHVKTAKRWSPASVNQAWPPSTTSTGPWPPAAPKSLGRSWPRWRPVAGRRGPTHVPSDRGGSPSARDRAMATVFFHGGLRLSELADLEVADVEMSARRGRLRSAPARATPTGRCPSTAPPARRSMSGSTPGPTS